jgi:hypothetical protein
MPGQQAGEFILAAAFYSFKIKRRLIAVNPGTSRFAPKTTVRPINKNNEGLKEKTGIVVRIFSPIDMHRINVPSITVNSGYKQSLVGT